MRPRAASAWCCSLLALAGAPAALPAWAERVADSAVQERYLEVSLNGVATGALTRFTLLPDGRLRIAQDDWRGLGLNPVAPAPDGSNASVVALEAVAGLTYTYDAAQQSIALRLTPALATPLALAVRPPRPYAPGQSDRGVLLNYDLSVQGGRDGRSAVLNELRYFDAHGAFSSSGLLRLRGPGARYLRHDSAWNWAAPDALRTLQVGDTVTRSLNWSRSLRIAGLEWRQNFALRPDLVTYPLADIAGSAVVPSSISLYVNGLRAWQGELPAGPYVLNGVGGLNGAGVASVVTRDALGRELVNALPLYVDPRLLAPGLSEYALAFGVPRRAYGQRSFDYAGYPVASASLRHGVHPLLTLEAHAEASGQLGNAGAGALLRLGQYGVVRGALALSRAAASGTLASVGYQYLSARWSLDTEHTRSSAAYADLGTREGAPLSRASDRLTLNLTLASTQHLALSYGSFRMPADRPIRLAALGYGLRLGQAAYFSLNGWHDLRRAGSRGVQAQLSLALPGRISASVSRGERDGTRSWQGALSRAADLDGGLGWIVQDGGQGAARYRYGELAYLGTRGRASAQLQRANGKDVYRVGLAGAVLAMDGSVFGARQVGPAFALVTTGLAGVPVLYENRLRGYTDADGRLLVTDLVAYAPNTLAIDTRSLPLDAWVERSTQELVPQQLSGVLARFQVERRQAASVIVHLPDGKPVLPGTHVQVAGALSTVAGHDGIVFLAAAQAQNRLVLATEAGPCALNFVFDAAASGAQPTLGPLHCTLTTRENP